MSKKEAPAAEPLAKGTRVHVLGANVEATIVGHTFDKKVFVEYELEGVDAQGKKSRFFAWPEIVRDLTPPEPEAAPQQTPREAAETAAIAKWDADEKLRATWKDDRAAYLADALKDFV